MPDVCHKTHTEIEGASLTWNGRRTIGKEKLVRKVDRVGVEQFSPWLWF
jgi:hypothetical protein